jgi:ABC-type amino acid transport substrate-binding protein
MDLWRELAGELGLEYDLKEFDLPGLLKAVQDRQIDAAVAALTVTAEREESMDFTHPLHTTGLSIAVIPRKASGWLRLLGALASWDFLKIVGMLALLLLIVGFLTWVFERRRNREQFGGSAVDGIGAGFWWSAVTMTTVGYGDKAPKTLGGRLVALVWMFAALVVIATFTGAIASSLTVGQLESAVRGPSDLPRVRVAAVEASTGEAYLRSQRIGYRPCKTAREALRLLAEREIDAFVYDAPLLKYLVASEFAGKLMVLPRKFERQDYAIALPAGSALREPINRVLLRKISQPQWQDTLYKYLGE